jgi:HK97 family phage prohead protease
VNVQALDERTFEQVCAHEAGHAAMCVLLGVPVRLVDVTGDETALGRTHHELGAPDTDADLATRMKIILGGLIESAESITDLPAWPLDADCGTTDQRRLALLARALGLDSAEYEEIRDETLDLSESSEYKRLHIAISHLLEQHGTLDQHTLIRIKHIVTEGPEMEHLLLKATVATVDTDLGEFQAVISTEAVDREKDIVSAAGMVTALRKWNRPVPLAWNHSTKAEDIIGSVDPNTVKAVDSEVVAKGRVDLDSTVGREAWRSFKSRAIGFSFGYLINKSTSRPGGGRHIVELDVFEVTATPTPMNNDTRVVDVKAVDIGYDAEYDELKRHFRDDMLKRLSAAPDADTLRVKAQRIAREHTPITVAEFDC